jgi:hypothetical protein
MKIRLTEKQLKYVINESERSNKAKELANNLLNDPNNEPIWKVIPSDKAQSIFANGYTSEYRGQGEGSYHGEGTYVFIKPDGAEKRRGTGGVGDLITKGVLVGGFKGFIILISELAEKYYGTSDLRYQLKLFYGEDMVDEIYQECVRISRATGCAIMSSLKNGRYNGPISAGVLSTSDGGRRFKPAKYRDLTLKSNVRGIVYNGGHDPYAAIIFDARSVIPLAITHNREINERTGDFDNWEYMVSEEMLDSYEKFKDYFPDGQRLMSQGLIKDYLQQPPRHGLLRVTLKNNKRTFFDIENKVMVSNVGFDEIYMPEVINNFIAIPVGVKTKNGSVTLYIVKNGNEYILCKKNLNRFSPIMRMSQYDKHVMSKNNLNENTSILNETSDNPGFEGEFRELTGYSGLIEPVYHRTERMDAVNGISEFGFSSEYLGNNGTAFGDGIYATPYISVCNDILRGFGNYMIHSYLKDGFKDFLILDPELARKYYGDKCSPEEQMKELIRPGEYDFMVKKYGSQITNPQQYIMKRISNDLGRTYIRGIVCRYHGCAGYICVVRNYNDCIPYSYSTDNGKTWTKILTKDNYEWINRSPDGLYSILPYINKGYIKDIYKDKNGQYNWKRIISKLQFRHGYLRVILQNGKVSFYSAEDKNLISYRGFDEAYNFEKDSQGRTCLDCLIEFNGKKYPFRVYRDKWGKHVLCIKNPKNNKWTPAITMQDYDGF